MKRKKYVGQLISVKYSDRPTPIYGFVVDYNDEWTLLKYNPTDYIIDGYIILRHKNIEGFRRDKEEKFREKVITLKGQHNSNIQDIDLSNLETILSNLTKQYGVFQFDLKSEKRCYLGRLKLLTQKMLTIDFLDTTGRWTNEMTFRPTDIRTIEFDTDYINSLKLISRPKKQKP